MRRKKDDRNRRQASAADVLQQFLKKRGLDKDIERHQIFVQWRALVGDKVANSVMPHRLDKRGTLWVHVSNSAWMHQVTVMKRDLLERIHHELGPKSGIKELRFVMKNQ